MALSPFLSRCAAVALLVAVLAGFWASVGAPLLAWRQTALERIDTARLRIERFGAALARAEADPPSAAPPEAAAPGETPALALAALQALLDAAVADAGGARRAAQALDPRPRDGFLVVSVTIDADLDPEALRDFLHAVETGTPFLFVDALDVRRPEGGLDAGGAPPEPLAVRATVSGVTTLVAEP